MAKKREPNLKSKTFEANSRLECIKLYDDFISSKRIKNFVKHFEFEENGKYIIHLTYK